MGVGGGGWGVGGGGSENVTLSHTRLDLYTLKPYQAGFLMFLCVLNEKQKMNDDR